jgi:hypothetical protein
MVGFFFSLEVERGHDGKHKLMVFFFVFHCYTNGETNYECWDVTKLTRGWIIQKTVSNWEIFFGWICHKHGQVFYDIVSIINDKIEKDFGEILSRFCAKPFFQSHLFKGNNNLVGFLHYFFKKKMR